MATLHSDFCAQNAIRKRCIDCRKNHRNQYQRQYRNVDKTPIVSVHDNILCSECKGKSRIDYCSVCKTNYNHACKSNTRKNISKQTINQTEPTDQTTQTRSDQQTINGGSVVSKARRKLIYHNLLCISCKDKAIKDFCKECNDKYNRERNNESYKNKKNKQSFNQTESSNAGILECSDSSNGVDKRKSVYSNFMCNNCKDKTFKDYCDKCKQLYSRLKYRKHYYEKKR